jgi:hypothetical protein
MPEPYCLPNKNFPLSTNNLITLFIRQHLYSQKPRVCYKGGVTTNDEVTWLINKKFNAT